MKDQAPNPKMLAGLMMRLLPAQLLLAAVGSVNGIVSSYFAANFVGVEAMTAVGLYNPLNLLFTALNVMQVGGAVILCGKYMGKNQQDKVQETFSLSMLLSAMLAVFFTVAVVGMSLLNLTGIFTKDATVRPLFNRYLLGQSIGIFPLLVGNLLTGFLSMENKGMRTTVASLLYIAVNILMTFLFVQVLKLEAFGLALANSTGLWVYAGVQAQYFLSRKSTLRPHFKGLCWKEAGQIVRVGLPGAASNGYQTIRAMIVNSLLTVFIGGVGISAYASVTSLMGPFWAFPSGMLAVSRMMVSVSVGEEDRRTLTDAMRVMFLRFIPLMIAVSAGIILCAKPLAMILYQDTSQPVYQMTVQGLRILPLCMPFSIMLMHFENYAQVSHKPVLLHILAAVDGVIGVASFAAILVRPMGIQGIFLASVLNGVTTTIIIIAYSWICRKKFPRTMDDLMVIPAGFGAAEDKRMDLSVRSLDEVVSVSRRVQCFCREQGIDSRRAMLAGLAMEEMAGNIVEHGFTKDKKTHSIDLRVVHKDDDVILRIKDDCVPFDPAKRHQMAEDGDVTKNIGLRMVFTIAKDLQYQNILGMNVLMVRI